MPAEPLERTELCGRPIGAGEPLFLFAGPCVVEDERICLAIAEALSDIARRLDMLVVFKASFDKANRTSATSFRGHGIDEGLRVLEKVRSEAGLPVITDVHTPEQARAAAEVVDVLQTPALLARQTDLIEAAAATGRPVNFKKGQFMAPADMEPLIAKARRAAPQEGGGPFLVCERGTSFGYNNLVVDMRGLVVMRRTGCPVVFDATHSVQLPGASGDKSAGQPEFVEPLARAAVAVGVAGLFMETHPDPANALSDGPNSIPLAEMPRLIDSLQALHARAGARLG
ncbi:3-deoxy-8-phosphooctulonate synthase [Sphingomonas ginkgonis]|uniref:2-dehydro-3-deoxyphosphooctonate aldolase n=1 Tax=Sphingomonas ginkgonis TaxID=2315330 RepID=A0A429V8X0_9SPHN|nr:3-deoxy-8-phosphooctulonate synthase [Sphingomonas ginkgonis]RST30374.1 3-deoxy-8-phosphooctulonate synthase [Sphingomonas ginkgonis]